MEILRLLWFTADGVTLIERRDGALLEPRHFPPEEEAGLAAFAAAAPAGRWRLVVERGEEECRLERLPRLRGGDRRRLLEATAERLFPHTPFRWRERLRVDGVEELWSFGALADPAPVNRLLARLPAGGVENLTSPARLLPHLLKRMGEAAGERLVAWRLHGGGLRLVLLREGRPAALRLAPPEAETEEALAATRDYLRRLGVWPEAAAEPLRLADGDPSAEALFVPLALGLRRPPDFRRSRWRGEVVGLAPPLLLAATLAAAGWQAAAALEAQRSALAAERALTAGGAVPGVPADPAGGAAERLVAAVERAEALRPFATAAAPLLGRLGGALEGFPEVTLERLAWRLEGERVVVELAGTVAADGAAERVAALALRIGREPGVADAVVSRPPPPVRGFGEVAGALPFELRVEARVDDGWG